MEKSSRNFCLEFLETGSRSAGSIGGVNPLQVLPECSGSTQNQPCDGSGSPFGAGASGALHSTRIFPAPAPDFLEPEPSFFWWCARFLFVEKTK
jgi:hypothetical protein